MPKNKAEKEAPTLARRLTSTTFFLATATVGLAVHAAFALPLYSFWDRMGAWLMLLVLMATLRAFLRGKGKSLPVESLIAGQVYVVYGLSQFSQERLVILSGVYTPSPEAVSSAVWLVLLGEAACLAAYVLATRAIGKANPFDRILPTPTRKWRTAAIVYAVPSLGVYALTSLRPEFLPVAYRMATVQVFNAYLALILLLYLGYRLGDRISVSLGWMMIFTMSAIAFLQGFMGTIVLPFAIGFIAARLWGKVLRVRWALLVIGAIFIVNPAKGVYRHLAWGDKDVSSLSKLTSRLGLWLDAFRQAWGADDRDSVRGNLMETANRSSDFLSFAQVIDFVPSRIPFNGGSGLETSLVYWVPRVLWPSKPEASDLINNRYAIEFGYITEEGTKATTIGASLFTEGYWNYGVAGVLISLTCAGALLGVLLGGNGGAGDASTIVSLAYMAGAIMLLQPLSMVLPGAVTFSVGIWLAFQLIQVAAKLLGARRELPKLGTSGRA